MGGAYSRPVDTRAATLVVSPTGDRADYSDIQQALNALPADGGIIYLREGTFNISAPITFPDKPIKIVGSGRNNTVINIGSNAISAFRTAFAKPFSIESLSVIGDNSIAQVFFEWTAAVYMYNPAIFRDIVVGSRTTPTISIKTLFKVPASGFGQIKANILNCSFDTANGQYLYEGNILGDFDISFTEITGDVRIQNEVLNIRAVGLTILSLRGVNALPSAEFTDCYINGSTDGAIQFGVTTSGSLGNKFYGCRFVLYGGIVFGNAAQGFAFVGNIVSALAARAIDVLLNAAGGKIIGNYFSSWTGEAVRINATNLTVSGNYNCRVTETGAANDNRYSDNSGFSGSTIIGPNSIVDGVRRRDVTGGTTTAAFVTVFEHKNAKGVVGIGTIKNTGGVNDLEVRETVTDAFGTTASVVTTVNPGNDYMLDPQTYFGAARPPHVSYKVEVRHPVAATTYSLRHATLGAE